jgi:PHP family Zn ribbon phosphoesterase
MSYYESNNDTWWIEMLIALGLSLLLIFGFNSCSAETWNNGACPECEVRYELRGASRGLKYYACPECGQEVERY